MLENSELLMFFTVVLLYAFMPGPAMLYSVAQTVSSGRKSGLFAVLGLHVGGYFHVTLVAFGLATAFINTPLLQEIVQKVGAICLIYLGYQKIISHVHFHFDTAFEDPSIRPPQKIFWDSVVVDVLNPKAALFYFAFLPQFVVKESEISVGLQLFILGTFTNLVFSSADLLCVLGTSGLRKLAMQKQDWLAYGVRWAGGILVILGGMAFLT
ncbi:LysE family translocator [Vibrio crassostreae]|uniref:RhtB family transporter n=1 Tax=Vibrio crassostreae TaxID=246167 RepID=A0ABM9QLN4_9VIBR|nr:LysE family translocator [Vibrio crassostreae]TCL22140.1 threonine/homoserine/homoserine lactone efflux protein [Vibrio crassostreae]TCT44844.1 threonine/homoserine/homoserine lactone efflux protein [Vibrio crassostreae]TCT52451.1 threonine/homoserine/homoserine lactone efflux protein [Vibrio crassostreae]CAK1931193.1 RhtB family transporter [Vibrio crassostreae]CAK1933974.1 RhtB family transporter [Vibrio crassostreae]